MPEYIGEPSAFPDDDLKRGFLPAVATLELESLLRLMPDRQSPPRNVSRYGLVAIHGRSLIQTSDTAGRSYEMTPADIATNYKELGGKPHIDTNLAIGLAYDKELRAVAAGCAGRMSIPRVIQVQQIQAVGLEGLSAEERRRTTGLYSGFYWRDTLVNAWIEVATRLRFDVVTIQGAAQNPYGAVSGGRARSAVDIGDFGFIGMKFGGLGMQPQPMEPRFDAYDDVARRMGFSPEPSTGDWRLELPVEQGPKGE